MLREFVETGFFQKCWNALGLTDAELRELQTELMENPAAGSVMQGTGGAQKVRLAFPGAGKSSNARIIYVDLISKERVFLLMAYPKSQQDNLTEEQKRTIKELVKQLQTEGR
jgi:hypothetical protein